MPPDQQPTVQRPRFVVLLLALTLLLFATPVLQLLFPAPGGGGSRTVLVLVFVIMLISAVWAVGRNRSSLIIAASLGAPAVVLQVLTPAVNANGVMIAGNSIGILFIGYVIVVGLAYLFTAQAVTVDAISASVCMYLLLGVLWSRVYTLLELLQPGSFAFPFAETAVPGRFDSAGTEASLYFSFVTMSTLGYGDIFPTSSAARMFAAVEAVAGQMYLAVLVARLVGLHIAQAGRASANAPARPTAKPPGSA